MYASIRRYTMGAGSIDDAMHIVDENLAEQLPQEPGFVAYQVLDTGNDTICSITVFSDEAGVERSNELAAEFVRDKLGDFDINRTEIFGGEVMVSRAASEVLQPAHH